MRSLFALAVGLLLTAFLLRGISLAWEHAPALVAVLATGFLGTVLVSFWSAVLETVAGRLPPQGAPVPRSVPRRLWAWWLDLAGRSSLRQTQIILLAVYLTIVPMTWAIVRLTRTSLLPRSSPRALTYWSPRPPLARDSFDRQS
ncbi:MAG: hypothetical protein EXQ81_10430 [Thermoleophilia bacterium]|nr:hypothetical protein [Thermoleophilia bacterium]